MWVGTGENNNRQSSSWGNGVYKSTDGGRTWQSMGLADTRHIGRIVIDPTNTDVVYVAATGHLWGANKERGVFKTTDGGRTWTHVLFVDENTGATELVMDPSNPRVLYAGMYQRQRTVFGFNGGGPGSGIYKTTDGGATWTRLAGGLPTGTVGRIGMDIYRANPRVLYARVEHETAGGVYRTDDAGLTWLRMTSENPRPMYFSQIRIDPANDHRLYMLGVALHISDDGGRTWTTNRSAIQEGLWPPGNAIDASIHSDHHAFWINPRNPRHLMTGSDGGVGVSFDRGLTWQLLDNMDLGQFYHVGFDMDVPYRVYGGMQDNLSFGGPSATRSYLGIANDEWFLIGAGDGFVSFADPTDANVVYTEWQNGSVVRVDRRTNERKSIKPQPARGAPPYRWNWNTPLIMSAHDNKTLYIGAERVFRTRDRGDSWEAVSGDLTSGADREKLSIMGVAGPEIRLSKHDGVSSYPTLVALAESRKVAGVIYAGADDGRIQMTRDGGTNWTDLTGKFPGLPAPTYVARLEPSAFVDGRVYAAFDGHHNDDYGTYLYASEDFGGSWKRLGDGIPAGQVVRTVAEDRRVADVLYAGTEFGLYVSIDRGASWSRWRANLPTVPVYGIAQHPRENDIILATHGRSIWIADDVTPIQEAATALKQDAFLFDLRPARQYNRAHDRWWMGGDQRFWGPNPPFGAYVSYHLRTAAKNVSLRVADQAGTVVRELTGGEVTGDQGLHRVAWDLRYAPAIPRRDQPRNQTARDPLGAPQTRSHAFQQINRPEADPLTAPFVVPGDYRLTLVVDGRDAGTRPVKVEPDWLIEIDPAARKLMHDTALSLHRWQTTANRAADRLSALTDEIEAAKARYGEQRPAEIAKALEGLDKKMTDLRSQLGVAEPGRQRGAGGGGGGGQVLGAQLSGLKIQVIGSTSAPTTTQMQSSTELERALRDVVDGVNAAEQTWRGATRSPADPASGPAPLVMPDRVK